ncbi:exodeoxyribonuclease VII large subunit [Arenicella xantha]|uniref:Exodeoxyribonuclease 7 large subunit n=1 Tax=Arenicella xantha TaxID=644221 RepID=A0A395JH64_9GAMM|nr:exodeoxyribonuclease VII large subunit [Arenicella xantha]RBP49297.1 exodeoxyribonuclease VII large subunit [Arenicella xantha]
MNQSPAVFQVSELAEQMRRLMETSYPEVWIEGELSSLSAPASGHLYFSLKDERSQLRCAMFKGRAGINRYRPKAGDLVRVRAKISVYTARGDLQCIVQHIEEAGEGLLQRQFEQLKQSLNAEGLFDQSHKQAVPSFAKHIGLITSPSGAAVRDIITTFKRRCPGIPITLYPATVQGDTAAASIVEAIQSAVQHQRADVLIVSRGGGSLEDLWCFNHEDVARAIYACPIPIVSGVGHEVDVTIADLVADLRAPTPTAAAEMLSPDTDQLQTQVMALGFRLPRSFARLTQRLAQNVDMTARQLTHPREQLVAKSNRLTALATQLERAARREVSSQQRATSAIQARFMHSHPSRQLAQHSANTFQLARRLQRVQTHTLSSAKQQFASLAGQLNLVSPLATIERGFSIARQQDDKIVRSIKDVTTGERIDLQVRDGLIHCQVEQTHEVAAGKLTKNTRQQNGVDS